MSPFSAPFSWSGRLLGGGPRWAGARWLAVAVGIIAAAPALAQDAVQAGELYVQSDPPGGTVLLDGVDTGEVTPVLLRGLDPGPHDLRVLQGCALAEEQVLLRARLEPTVSSD